MERRFHCTACGKCCYGKLPLTLNDAVANAERFPLAMMWTTIRQGAKSFAINARLGTCVKLGKRKQVAVQITPVSYLPPSLPCPALAPDGLCSIHADKPSRCRTMPFYPYREEGDQSDQLVPRKGWLCETSGEAPVVYLNKKIVHREDFERERRRLMDQTPVLRAYADGLMANAPNVAAAIEKEAKKPRGGFVILNFTAIVSRLPQIDMAAFAQKQLPVLTGLADKTAGMSDAAEFHQYYRDSAKGMERFLERL
ncbi:MAG TPA: YkgJ family cysteine cluster protein [Rhodospirillales bacterium]|nr:YkgJ family cysteine cluster protein [Rhodospirillales bacterium]